LLDVKGGLKSEKSKSPEGFAMMDGDLALTEHAQTLTTSNNAAGLRQALKEVVAILKS
jgi:hydroxymethylpyrimidine pyrophosphatase-like HAD family hydrolase